MSRPPPDGLRRRGAKKYRKIENESSGSSSSLHPGSSSLLPSPDTSEYLTESEDFYDVDRSNTAGASGTEEDDEYGTDLEDYEGSSDESGDDQFFKVRPEYNHKEMEIYLETVLGRPLCMVTTYQERPEGIAMIESNSIDQADSLDESRREETPALSELEDFEQSDFDETNEHALTNEEMSFDVDSVLQSQFARLSTTENEVRGRSNSDVDESGVSPSIIISNYADIPSDSLNAPTTDEEILSGGEGLHHNSQSIRTKRYPRALTPVDDTESESESERYLLRSRKQAAFRSLLQAKTNAESLPTTDSESLELDDEKEKSEDSHEKMANQADDDEMSGKITRQPLRAVSEVSMDETISH